MPRPLRLANLILTIASPALAVFCAPPARADGGAFKGRDWWSRLTPTAPGEQVAVLALENRGKQRASDGSGGEHAGVDGGCIEHLLLALNLELADDERAVWILPVCGAPGQVTVDVVDSFPRFAGRDPRPEAFELVQSLTVCGLATQLYPCLACWIFLPALSTTRGLPSVVHSQVDKWGIRSQTLQVASLDELSAHLAGVRTKLTPEQLKTFAPYFDEGGYTFVVTWIESREALRKQFPQFSTEPLAGAADATSTAGRWPCLSLRFPTKRLFYPMRGTRVYAPEKVIVRLAIVGFVNVDPALPLAEAARAGHYVQYGRPAGTPDAWRVLLPDGEIDYSAVQFYQPADTFTCDLWFDPVRPRGMESARWLLQSDIRRAVVPAGLLLHGVLSYLSAGIAGLLIARRWRGYARLGLWNYLTFLGVVLAVHRISDGRTERLHGGPRFGRFPVLFPLTFSVVYFFGCLAAGWAATAGLELW